MFKNLFKKREESIKKEDISIFSPVEGEIISIEDTPDEVFAGKMLGDGFSIKPKGNKIYAPVSGEIKVLFPTLHAVAIETEDGLEILIHIGIDTVQLDGEGFTGHVKVGDKVKQGDLLVSFDKAIIEEKAKSSITPLIITNMDVVEDISIDYGNKDANEKVATIKLK
ncbi:MAG: PTS glucose transporter subunit IIA [Tissierellaceae bacterium]